MLCAQLKKANHAWAVELAALPQQIRGFGPVKAAAMEAYAKRRAELLSVSLPDQPENGTTSLVDTQAQAA
jgi:indolepyruvate ferredoxin oxidoreductase